MKRATLIAVFGLLVASPTAVAAPPWSVSQNVSSTGFGIWGQPHVGVDADGRALATWVAVTNPVSDVKSGYSLRPRLAFRDPGAAEFRPEQDSPSFDGAPILYGSGRVLGLSLLDDPYSSEPARLDAISGTPPGGFSAKAIHTFTSEPMSDPALALHRNAVAAWAEETGYSYPAPAAVRASIRRPGRDFGRSRKLSRAGWVGGVVAGAGPGVVFVAWERNDRVEARVKPRGRPWGPVQRLGSATRDSITFAVAFSGRRAYLAWLDQDVLGEPADANPSIVRTAILPGGRTRFRVPRTVDRISRRVPREPGRIALAALRGHGALVAWTDWDGRSFRARAAVTGRRARFGRPISVSPPGEPAVLADVESIPAGRPNAGTVLAVWSSLDATGMFGERVRAAVRGATGRFRAGEDVSDVARAPQPDLPFFERLVPDLAFDRVSRRWIVVWAQPVSERAPPPFDGAPTTVLRSATRPG